MNKVKQYFPMPLLLVLLIGAIHSVFGIASSGFNSAWSGAALANIPLIVFMGMVMAQRFARTSANLPYVILPAILGVILAGILPYGGLLPPVYALIGFVGSMLYIFWYSRLGREQATALVVGSSLPDFALKNSKGEMVKSANIRMQPALLMFFRGNWCPLCMTQIREVAARYRELNEKGFEIYLIGAQSDKQTAELAAKFDVPMHFLNDGDGSVAKQLGIAHENGLPKGVGGFENDTIFPTIVMTDATGKIIFSDQTDNYRVRPEPETFLKVANSLVIA